MKHLALRALQALRRRRSFLGFLLVRKSELYRIEEHLETESPAAKLNHIVLAMIANADQCDAVFADSVRANFLNCSARNIPEFRALMVSHAAKRITQISTVRSVNRATLMSDQDAEFVMDSLLFAAGQNYVVRLQIADHEATQHQETTS